MSGSNDQVEQIDVDAAPSGDGCVECDAMGSWWVHLRRCAACGHIGCCDSSLNRHASRHSASTGHRYIQSYEPGESWWWDFTEGRAVLGPSLAPPTSHPVSQSVPGPADRLPPDWESQLDAARDALG
ncbi:UBP-type zinc finger domain-containing protein [Microbacterium sp. VKM Ac-2870]|uniref:UBP-type zinc finger domain-containing protein n=1 Tax=Microbacterium sp. VKM Ac-2870 TaxID=2783825 RepID=UPI00188D0D1A|nr:UBP-type zinc finger domain-containing protein [Microbacterium sp. VKM Ac-2870]MBF4563157.1 UBP-type zinc finger domain-containing protein [Microbacterium sp. VKM Ac-2870]